MPGVSADIVVQITGRLTQAVDMAVREDTLVPIRRQIQLAPGNGAVGKADLQYEDSFTVPAGGSVTIDLVGAMEDAFGEILAFAQIALLYISSAKANNGALVVGNATSNAWVGPWGATGTYTVLPGDYCLEQDDYGWSATPTTDKLKVSNTGTAVAQVDILLCGRSVAAVEG